MMKNGGYLRFAAGLDKCSSFVLVSRDRWLPPILTPRRILFVALIVMDGLMAPKYHPLPLSGGLRKALKKELGNARVMTGILARESEDLRAKGEALIRRADKLLCESWNERMWANGEPIDPSPLIDQACNGGYPWLEVECSRCKTPNDVDLAALPHPATTFVHDLASRLRCRKCAKVGRRPSATLLQLAPHPRGNLEE